MSGRTVLKYLKEVGSYVVDCLELAQNMVGICGDGGEPSVP
jgi:hypothetical protein